MLLEISTLCIAFALNFFFFLIAPASTSSSAQAYWFSHQHYSPKTTSSGFQLWVGAGGAGIKPRASHVKHLLCLLSWISDPGPTWNCFALVLGLPGSGMPPSGA